MRIHHNERCGYDLDQEEEIDEILHDTGMESEKIVQTPIEDDCYEKNLGDEYPLPVHAIDGQPTLKAFQSLVRILLWLARCSRPDIIFCP